MGETEGGGGRGGGGGELIKMSMSNQPDLIAVSNKTWFHCKGYSSLRKGKGWVFDTYGGWGGVGRVVVDVQMQSWGKSWGGGGLRYPVPISM